MANLDLYGIGKHSKVGCLAGIRTEAGKNLVWWIFSPHLEFSKSLLFSYILGTNLYFWWSTCVHAY